ncbi:autotransporter adhesin BigA, partial [Enterobacter cloacae complex sp. P6RS]|uniref:autotransporter adhesin BigA n=2 Tax=unclassified Enterobacter cloacae complex TaxID=2757714 RepID=UPI001874BD77
GGENPGDDNDYTDWDVDNKLEGDGNENSLDKDTSAGAGEIGNLVTGNNTDNTISGDTDVTEGGKGTVVDGKDTTTTSTGDVSVGGEGSVGLEVNGSGANVINEGSTEVEAGGTGTVVNGNDANVSNSGDTSVSGEGSAGTVINGDNGNVEQAGDLNVTDGGAGTVITGNDANVTNTGNAEISGGGSGTVISGDNGTVSNTGNTNVSGEGSAGVVIDGNNSSVEQSGDLTVADGGTGIAISGDNSNVALNGDMLVTGGATGVNASGNNTFVSNRGTITVRDADSVGILVSGLNAEVSNQGSIYVTDYGTGASLSGDGFSVVLDGTVTAEARENRTSATGVLISGSNGTLQIAGDVRVVDTTRGTTDSENPTRLTGVDITGSDNRIVIDGSLVKHYEGYIYSAGSQDDQRGLQITGNNNILEVNGGIDFSHVIEDRRNYGGHYGFVVEGNDNTILINGQSKYNIEGVINDGGRRLGLVGGGGNTVILGENSVLDITVANDVLTGVEQTGHSVFYIGEGNTLINRGMITSSVLPAWGIVNGGGNALNEGSIDIQAIYDSGIVGGKVFHSGSNANAGTINITSFLTLEGNGGISGTEGGEIFVKGQTAALSLSGGGTSVNTAGGAIHVAGAGTFGMTAQQGTLLNEGLITVDGMQRFLDNEGVPTDEKALYTPNGTGRVASMALRGTGMHLRTSGSMINTGTLTVTNSGTGMYAAGTSTAINQGTINLESDGSHDEQGWIYAMVATDNGVAVNGTDGVININTDLGQAFYTAGNGIVINHGTVNLHGSEIQEGNANWGADEHDFDGTVLLKSVISKTGEVSVHEQDVLALLQTASYGNIRFDGDLEAKGWLHNFGEMTVSGELRASTGLENAGTLTAERLKISGGVNRETGIIHGDVTMTGIFSNDGTLYGSMGGGGSTSHRLINNGTLIASGAGNAGMYAANLYNQEGAHIYNAVSATTETAARNSLMYISSGSVTPAIVNAGKLTATDGWMAMKAECSSCSSQAWMANTESGVIQGVMDSSLNGNLVYANRGYHFYNAGEITVQGNDATAVSMGGSSTNVRYMVNDGVINVGTEEGQTSGTNGSGLTGIRGSATNTRFYNNSGGEINVWADNSYAFNVKGTVYNFGTVNLYGEGSAIYHPDSTQGTETGNDYSRPNISSPGSGTTPPVAPAESNASLVSNYIVGTNADGSAGTLSGNSLHLDNTVTVDTGFVAGTADRQVTFSDVFKGNQITGEENIGSTTVVWNASAGKNSDGNVDVTMTKNEYAAVATDGSVASVATALDKGYTSNALFSSLNVSSAAALNKALQQVSGAQAKSLNREARVLGHRFSQLADTAPQVTDSGLAFNVVARGDKRAEMDNKVSYDMMSLAQRFDTGFGDVTASYGIARLQGQGGNQANRAGDNGLTGGYSQFFGLGHSLPLSDDSRWNNNLRWDIHQLDSSRSLNFEGTSRVAKSSGRQQHLSFRSEGVKDMSLNDSLTVSPFAGMKMRHHITEGYSERGAGDFNLTTNSYNETSVDAVAGLRLNYAGENGWGAQATLEGGPNLGFSQSARKASLQGMKGQQFRVDDGKRGGGVNSQLSAGVNYQTRNLSFGAQAYQWKEDGASDNGFSLSVSRSF